MPIISSAPTGTWRVAAYTDPKRPPVGQASFLVEDYVPERLEFDLTTKAKSISTATPAEIEVDGRFLYGAPASGLTLDGELRISRVSELPASPGFSFGQDVDDQDPGTEIIPLADLPETDAAGKARFEAALTELPASTRPLQAQILVRMAEPGGRAVERTLTLPVTPPAPMIGIKPLFSGKSLGESATASFEIIVAAPGGEASAAKGLKWQLLRIEFRATNGIKAAAIGSMSR